MGASCGDCSRTRQHHCENDLRRPARTGGPESADKRQPSAFLLPATPRPRGNAGFLTIIPRQAPPAEKEPRPSQPCGVHRRAWRHHPGRRPQPFPQLRQCPGAAKGSPRAKSLRAQKHAENTRNGAQKRTRTALRMSQNCENFDLGYLSEAPVGAPRMYFFQRIWVPSPEKLNDFNRRLLVQNSTNFQQICMAEPAPMRCIWRGSGQLRKCDAK